MAPIRMSSLVSLIQKRFFIASAAAAATSAPKLSPNSPLPTSSSSSSITVQFLTDSCGLPLQSALSVSKKFQIHPNKLQNSQSVLQLLKAYHFTDFHIAKLIKKQPQILHSSVESTLKPKLDFFILNGIAGKLLSDVIVTTPAILHRDLDSHIKPNFEYLKSIFGCNEDIVAVLKLCTRLFLFVFKDTLPQNIDFLMKEGVPFDRLVTLFRLYPMAIVYKLDRVVCAVNAIKNLGMKPEGTMFVHALGVMMQVTESGLKEKTEIMKGLRFSEEEALDIFKRFPTILRYSEKKIRIAMDFFVNTMKLEHNFLVTCPYFLGFSVDKPILPRYNVIKTLQSRKLIELEKKSIRYWLVINEMKFLKNYVSKYVDEVPGLLELYQGTGKHKTTDA